MRNTLVRRLSSMIVALSLAGCGAPTGFGSSSGLPSNLQSGERSAVSNHIDGSAHDGWLSAQAATGKQLLYVADQFGQTVYVYPQGVTNPKPIGAITQGVSAPDGLFVDHDGALYVCNFGAGTVTVFPKGSISPSKTLTGAGVAPIDVVVGRDGTVYVADFNEGQNGHVYEYAGGSTTPTTTIDLAGYPEGLALDHHNNLYVAYQSTVGTVLRFTPGSTTGTDLHLDVALVGGAAIDANDDLLVVDQSNPAPHVDVFPLRIAARPRQIGGFALAFDVALNARNDRMYVTEAENPAAVYEVSYPAGTIVQRITNSLTSAFGVATSPDGSP